MAPSIIPPRTVARRILLFERDRAARKSMLEKRQDMKINIKRRKGALTAQPLPDSQPDQIVAMPVELLTVREAASIARVSEPTIRRWLRCEGLPRFGSKGRVRIDQADLMKFLKGEGI